MKKSRPLLITGAAGTLGQSFARICGTRNINYKALNRQEMDNADIESVRKVVYELKPWAVINAAGFVNVEEAEKQKDLCFRENVTGPVNLANVCEELGIPFVTFSSDLVFDGEHDDHYLESHKKNPLSIYGQSKATCEEEVLKINSRALVIRTSSFFGPWDNYNFLTITLRQLLQDEEVHVLGDVHITPTFIPDLVDATLDLLIDGETGLLHLTNQGPISWTDLALMAAVKKKLPTSLILKRNLADFKYKARIPKNSVLTSERLNILPGIESAVDRYLNRVIL